MERMHRRPTGVSSKRVFPCHLIDNINTIFGVIVNFDRFWDLLGIIRNADAGCSVLRVITFLLVLP